MAVTKDIKTAKTSQEIDNLSFDTVFNTKVVELLGFDGQSVSRLNSDNLALKITVVGTATYVGQAAPGTDQASALWQAFKYDNGVLTYADGNSNFDNVATDLTSLTYS